MEEWLKLFYSKDPDITLTINGKTYQKTECVYTAKGSEKKVYTLKGENQCFFIPNRWSTEEDWNTQIYCEKNLLDKISGLGLKAQQFDIIPIKIQQGDASYTIKALLTKDFKSLCEEESIVIYNRKGDLDRVVGKPSVFENMFEQLNNKMFVQKMFKKLIEEYAIALAFSLPIRAAEKSIDDSQHFCFELPAEESGPPIIRYMFWDVVGDFFWENSVMVPTLHDLKIGPESRLYTRLHSLVNEVICAISALFPERIRYDDFKKVEAVIESALSDDPYLDVALAQARAVATDYFANYLSKVKEFKGRPNNAVFVKLMRSSISTDNLDLVKQSLEFHPNFLDLTNDCIDEIMETAKKYNNNPIVEFLTVRLVGAKSTAEQEQLKATFMKLYEEQLVEDKSSCCSLYRFFATSHVKESMTLKELVAHAQGLSGNGSGSRSQAVMKGPELNWLNEDNQVNEAIREYLL